MSGAGQGQSIITSKSVHKTYILCGHAALYPSTSLYPSTTLYPTDGSGQPQNLSLSLRQSAKVLRPTQAQTITIGRNLAKINHLSQSQNLSLSKFISKVLTPGSNLGLWPSNNLYPNNSLFPSTPGSVPGQPQSLTIFKNVTPKILVIGQSQAIHFGKSINKILIAGNATYPSPYLYPNPHTYPQGYGQSQHISISRFNSKILRLYEDAILVGKFFYYPIATSILSQETGYLLYPVEIDNETVYVYIPNGDWVYTFEDGPFNIGIVESTQSIQYVSDT
jgi:hypothetical protein